MPRFRSVVMLLFASAPWFGCAAPSQPQQQPPPPTSPPNTGVSIASAVTRCPGATRKPGCHSRMECVCEPGPAPTGGCGIPPHRHDACGSDGDCGAGKVCLGFVDNCELGTRCSPRCTATTCTGDDRCQSDGRCGPRPCSVGFDCAAYGACAVGATGADRHGCVPYVCAVDADCPCAGFCINERCAGSQGVCLVPRG